MNRKERRHMQSVRRRLKLGPITAPFEVVSDHYDGMRRALASTTPPNGLVRTHRNGHLLVFECERHGGLTLLMIQRYNGADGLTWDDLQRVKSQLGFGACEAVELYPRKEREVNVANIRHLWVLPPGHVMPFGIDAARRNGGL